MGTVLQIRGFSADVRSRTRGRALLDWLWRRGRPFLEIRDLRLESGKVYAVLGKSGAGKSVLNSLLMGYPASRNIPSSGDMRDWIRPTVCLYLPQLLPDARGYDMRAHEYFRQISHALLELCEVPPLPPREFRAWLRSHMDFFRLGRKKLRELSGGERRRLELMARQLALETLLRQRPDARALLILDEPTTGFDWKTQRDFLADLHREAVRLTNGAVLVTTHAVNRLWDDVFDGVVFVAKEEDARSRDGRVVCRVSRTYDRKDVLDYVRRVDCAAGRDGGAEPWQNVTTLYDFSLERLEQEIGEEGRDAVR